MGIEPEKQPFRDNLNLCSVRSIWKHGFLRDLLRAETEFHSEVIKIPSLEIMEFIGRKSLDFP